MLTILSIHTIDSRFLLIAALIFLLAGFVKGVVGLGLPTVAVGLLGLFMLPLQAAALLIIPSLVTNVWQLLAGGRLLWLLRRFWRMMLGIILGTLLGAQILPDSRELQGMATIALGGALMVYAVVGLTSVQFTVRPGREGWLAPVIGGMTGMVTALTAVFVIPAVPFLQALQLDKDELIAALGLSFTVSTLAMAGALMRHGALQPEVAGLSLMAVVPALVGMWIGQSLRARISARIFRRCFFIGLLLLGLHLAWH